MYTKLTLNPRNLIFGIPILLVAFIWALINSQFYSTAISIPVTLDLILTTPLVYYLLIRKREIPKYTVVSVFILSIVLASFIIPENDQGLLVFVKTYALPLVELGVLILVIWKARQIYKTYKDSKSEVFDFFNVISDVTKKVLPDPINAFLASEIAVVYFALFNWKKRQHYTENEYSYHRKNGIISVLYAFMGLAIIELVVAHIFISYYSEFWAWVATFLTSYSLLQIFALIKSMSRRPIVLNHEKRTLQLRYGFFSQVDIHLDLIDNIELSRKSIPEEDKSTIALSPLGLLDTHNMIVHLNAELELTGLYGRKKKFSNISIYVDDRENLTEKIIKLNNIQQ